MPGSLQDINILSVVLRKAKRAFEIWKEYGAEGVYLHISQILQRRREKRSIDIWLRKHRKLDGKQREFLLSSIEALEHKPLISILLPVYDVGEKWLRCCLDSVLNQLYQNWELCIADDHSTKPHVLSVLQEYSAKDSRIKVIFRNENGHISKASNSALELATGEFLVLLDHDDELSQDALFWVANELNDFPECDMIYSDEDMIDEKGVRYGPKFKPDWSRDLMYSLNLVTHLSAYRTDLVRSIGGFREGYEGSQDYDLALRVIERIPEQHVRHIPRILYHWRAIRGSVAYSADEKPYAHERARDAIRSHFDRMGTKASVSKSIHNLHRVLYEVPASIPRVTVILHGQSSNSVGNIRDDLRQETEYENIQLTVASSTDRQNKSGRNLAERLNTAALESDGTILCFVEAGIIPSSRSWLRELVGFAIQNEIGAVGGKIILRNGTVLHAGYVVGVGYTIASAHEGFTSDTPGNMLRNLVTSNFSAVSISCLVIRRELFEAAGKFDSSNLPSHFFDVDLCLKLRDQGYRNVVVSDVKMIKANKRAVLNCEEQASNSEHEYFAAKWKKYLENDPFHNPNLSKKDGTFSVKL